MRPLELLSTPYVTAPTKRVLQKRLEEAPTPHAPRFFDPKTYEILSAVCHRLVPGMHVDVAAAIDLKFTEGTGKGWRYDRMPEDRLSFPAGLASLGAAGFLECDSERQNAILQALPPGDLFFEELLAMAVEIYYAHPVSQDLIGYTGFADAAGWHRIGLNEREPWE